MRHDPIERADPPLSSSALLKPEDLYVAAVRTYETKCKTTSVATFFSGTLGGALIGFAGLFYLIVMTDNNLSGGIAKLIGGLSFSLGLVMISITGADLFTGNVMALLPKGYRMVSIRQIARNWGTVYSSNFAGALLISLGAAAGGMLTGGVADSLDSIVASKLSHGPVKLLVEGMLCNALVCLAIWMGMSTRSPSGRVMLIAGPITAFVAMGLEHSIANMFFFSAAFFAGVPLALDQAVSSLAIVTLGNVLGSALLCVFLAFAFRRPTLARLSIRPAGTAGRKTPSKGS